MEGRNSRMKICFISLFPETIEAYNNAGMMRKAQEIGAAEFIYLNLRDFGLGPRKQVDDTPYGGGDGMVLRPEPIVDAIKAAKELLGAECRVLLPTPRGNIYTQETAKNFASLGADLIIVCPRYEGYDERVISYIDEQICVGSYVLTGGEIPAMMISDSLIRLLPDVLGGTESVDKESFQNDLNFIEHAQYTRPDIFEGQSVPEVLKNGNHAEIDKWRIDNSKG